VTRRQWQFKLQAAPKVKGGSAGHRRSRLPAPAVSGTLCRPGWGAWGHARGLGRLMVYHARSRRQSPGPTTCTHYRKSSNLIRWSIKLDLCKSSSKRKLIVGMSTPFSISNALCTNQLAGTFFAFDSLPAANRRPLTVRRTRRQGPHERPHHGVGPLPLVARPRVPQWARAIARAAQGESRGAQRTRWE
jgi:hypothetical protein